MSDLTPNSQFDRENRFSDAEIREDGDLYSDREDDLGSIADLILAKIERSWLKQLMTPWGIGGMSLLLLTNILLSWAYLSNSRQEKTAQNVSESSSAATRSPSQKQPPSNPRLKAQKSQTLNLETLSSLTFAPSIPVKTTRVPANTPPAARSTPTPSNPQIPSQSSSDLTKALLPPSLRPELPPSYPVAPSVMPISTAQQPSQLPPPTIAQSPAVPAPQLPPPTITQSPLPAPNSTKPVISEEEAPSEPNEPQTQFSQQEFFDRQQQEEMKAQEEASRSFNQRTRMKLQTIYNQSPENQPPQDPKELLEQLQQPENQDKATESQETQ